MNTNGKWIVRKLIIALTSAFVFGMVSFIVGSRFNNTPIDLFGLLLLFIFTGFIFFVLFFVIIGIPVSMIFDWIIQKIDFKNKNFKFLSAFTIYLLGGGIIGEIIKLIFNSKDLLFNNQSVISGAFASIIFFLVSRYASYITK